MNRVYHVFLLIVLLLSSCISDQLIDADSNRELGKVKLVFTTDLSAATAISRAGGESDSEVTSLDLLVFSEAGLFLEKAEAKLEKDNMYSVHLSPSLGNPRVVHFIANYGNWDSADLSKYKDEGEIIPLLEVKSIAMWNRLELDQIGEETFKDETVELLRNMATVTLQCNSQDLKEVSFKLINKPSLGTVAPFDSWNASFNQLPMEEDGTVHYPITESAKLSLESEDTYTDTPSFSFERSRYIDSDKPLYLLIKGKYKEESKDTYYKIALVDKDNTQYDIERNFEYKVTINEVLKSGYSTEEDAMAGAASNNITMDPLLEKFPIISSGDESLEVEKTLFVCVNSEEDFKAEVWFKNEKGKVYNEGIELIVDDHTWNSVFKEKPKLEDGVIKGKIKKIGETQEETSTSLVVVKNGLRRTITVVCRTPYKFENLKINGLNPTDIKSGQSNEATLTFTIPNEVKEELFPLPVKIYTEGLTINEAGLKVGVDNGRVYYTYLAPMAGDQTVELKTNNRTVEEEVSLESLWFSRDSIAVTTKEYSSMFKDIKYNVGLLGIIIIDVPYNADVQIETANEEADVNIKMTGPGKCEIVLSGNYSKNDEVTITYRTYMTTLTIANLIKDNTNITLKR